MIDSLLAAFAAFVSQPASPPPAATYVVYGDYGRPGETGNIQRLLDEWRADGTIRGEVRRVSLAQARACIGDRHDSPIDQDCIRDLAGTSPAVAIVARDAGRVIPFLNLTCIGPRASGRGTAQVNLGGAYSSIPRIREQTRDSVRACLAAALPPGGSTASPQSFDTWGATGDAYHRLSGDCDMLRHRIGRNATRGSHSSPLQSARLTLAVPTRVRLICLSGACITSTLQGRTTTGASHDIAFDTEARASAFVRQVNDLKRACRR